MSEISEKNSVSISVFDITTADSDIQARLRLGGLVNLLIQAAINSADSLGFGFEGLHRQQLFWVLSRLTVEIYHPLKWYDKAFVETWPKDVEGLLYLRDFMVRNQEGEVVAKCTSGWLAIDMQTKRPKLVDEKYSHIFNRMKDKHALEYKPEKLFPVETGESFAVKTTWFDLDVNKHVTSTRYIDWMMDALPVQILNNHYPLKLSINYMKETMLGDTIKITCKAGEAHRFIFEGRNAINHTVTFRGSISF